MSNSAAYKDLTDYDLVSLLKDEDRNAFIEIYHRYWAPMYLYARKLIQDMHDAEDIVQEVLDYIWTERMDLKINTTLADYLYSSVRYKGLSVIKESKNYDQYLGALTDFIDKGMYTTNQSIREKELIKNIEEAIAALPAKIRELFN